MKRKAVDSSGIQTIGYDPVEHILEVEFVNDSVYRYMNVPEMIYLQLMNASSKGTFFNKKIRDGGFDFRKIR